jgi:hypothetical protein
MQYAFPIFSKGDEGFFMNKNEGKYGLPRLAPCDSETAQRLEKRYFISLQDELQAK